MNFDHSHRHCIGVLMTNLGTPESPDTSAVRRFLKQFLWDPRVVEVPRAVWWWVLNVVILNTRPRKSARAYQKVWTEKGSPLMTISMEQVDKLRQALEGLDIIVEPGMRYGSPSLVHGLTRLKDQGATRILILPLYPQYSATTTATTFDAIASALKSWRWIPELRFINHYHDHKLYIEALAVSVENHWKHHGQADRLLMSFHGIPKEYFHNGDPYYCECQKTARLLGERLGITEEQYQVSFQSRLGPKQWLQPYTDQTLESLPGEGVHSVQVLCPGFSADCLETLEEIAMENKAVFMNAGGQCYEYIPCLNIEPAHIEMMKTLVLTNTQGWNNDQEKPEHRQQRAINLGAPK
ncbi:MAG: ferrochelatase [bacterium]